MVVPHLLEPLVELLFLSLKGLLIDLEAREQLQLLCVLFLLEVHQLDQSFSFVLGDLQLLSKQERALQVLLCLVLLLLQLFSEVMCGVIGYSLLVGQFLLQGKLES